MRLIDADLLKQNCKITGEFDNHFQCVDLITLGQVIDSQPTVDEKEIIRKAFERVVERVENARQKYQRLVKEQGEKEDEAINILFRGMIKIVKEEGGIE